MGLSCSVLHCTTALAWRSTSKARARTLMGMLWTAKGKTTVSSCTHPQMRRALAHAHTHTHTRLHPRSCPSIHVPHIHHIRTTCALHAHSHTLGTQQHHMRTTYTLTHPHMLGSSSHTWRGADESRLPVTTVWSVCGGVIPPPRQKKPAW